MTIQWVSADLLTGRVIADLPGFDAQWPLRRTISNYETATGTLHLIDQSPVNWERAIYEGGSLLFCYDDGDPLQAILWCGYVVGTPSRSTSSNDVTVTLATFEAILDRVYVGDTTYLTTQHRDDIIADLINSWFIPGSGISYLQLAYTAGNGPFPVAMPNPPVANAALVFQNTDNATVKARIDQVCAQLGGEYTVDWAWANSNQNIVPTIRFSGRIGQKAAAGLAPGVTFEMPGVLISAAQSKDYSQGAGANKVTPYSTGQGSNTTPFGTPVLGPVDGRPTWEYRYQPAPSLTAAQLQQYATQAVGVLAPGKQTVTLVAATARTAGRRYGTDWMLGDDIGYNIPASYLDERGNLVAVRAFPNGLSGVGRVIGFELTDISIAPLLADATIYTWSG